MKTTVVSSMRNEGAFLLEWVVWQRMIGFSDILVVTNACTDHSPALLEALAAVGWVHWIDVVVPPGRPIVRRKMVAAKRHPAVMAADWVMVCDVDEFLVVHAGNGHLADLLAVPGRPFLGMSINWRLFGSSGLLTWKDDLVHRQFLHCGSVRLGASRWMKSIHRRPDWFTALAEHGPVGFQPDRAAGDPGLIWVNSEGEEVPEWQPDGPYMRSLKQSLTTHHLAQINHYMARTPESFGLKRGTLSPVAGKDRYTDAYYKRADQNAIRDESALRYAAEFDALYAEAMALPGVARLHHLCCADYAARLAEKAGLTPEEEPRWWWHRTQAEVAGD